MDFLPNDADAGNLLHCLLGYAEETIRQSGESLALAGSCGIIEKNNWFQEVQYGTEKQTGA